MNKFYVFLIGSMLLVGCQKQEKVDYMIFSGKISNTNAEQFLIKGDSLNYKILIKEDGTFLDTLKITDEGYHEYFIGRERSGLYLTKGMDLNLTIDTKEFDESIVFTGIGEGENNFLANKFLKEEQLIGDRYKFYSLDAPEYKNKIIEFKESISGLLKNTPNLSEGFVKSETANNQYGYLLKLMNYSTYHKRYSNVGQKNSEEQDVILPVNFLDELEGFNYQDENAFKTYALYNELVMTHYSNKRTELAAKYDGDYLKAFMEIADSIPNKLMKDEYVYQRGFRYGMFRPDENLEEMYAFFMKNGLSENYKKEYKETYEKYKTIIKGKSSPIFDYENYKGGKTSLTDLKGKYVYIDIWATWCAPCKAEIPSLGKLEKKYHNKNIEFVSISIDQKAKYDEWKKMVEEKELGGIQLYADNNWKSKFMKEYAVRSIPRFILVNPEGSIVTADAPRPSNPKLVELFDELNI